MIEITLETPYVRPSGSRLIEGQRRLMAAVLKTAVDDCRGSAHRRTRGGYGKAPNLRDVVKANAYTASRDREWPFSFENLCEALGVDAESLRRELRQRHGA